MTINTSATISSKEIKALEKINEELVLNNMSLTIRMSLKMTEKVDLDKYIDRSEISKEEERKLIHYSSSEEIFLYIESLADFHGVSKSKIVGAAILAFSEQDFFLKK